MVSFLQKKNSKKAAFTTIRFSALGKLSIFFCF